MTSWIDQLFDDLAAAGTGPGVGIRAEEWMNRFPFNDNVISGLMRQMENDMALNEALGACEMATLYTSYDPSSSIRFRGEPLNLSTKILIFAGTKDLARKVYKILYLLRRVETGDLSAHEFGKLTFKATRITGTKKAYFRIFIYLPIILKAGQVVFWDDFSTLSGAHDLQSCDYKTLSERILADPSLLRSSNDFDMHKIPLEWSVNKRKAFVLHARLNEMLQDGMGKNMDNFPPSKFLKLCKDHPYLGLRFVDGLLPKDTTEFLKTEFGDCNCDRLSFTIPARPNKIKEYLDDPFRLMHEIQVHIPGQELDSTLRRIQSTQAMQNAKETDGPLVMHPLLPYNPPPIRPPNVHAGEYDEELPLPKPHSAPKSETGSEVETESEPDIEAETEAETEIGIETYCTLPPKLGFFPKLHRHYDFISRKLLKDNKNVFFHNIPDIAKVYEACIPVQLANGLYHATASFSDHFFEATAGRKGDSRSECISRVIEFLYENLPETYLPYLPVHLMVSIDVKGDVKFLVEQALGRPQPQPPEIPPSEDALLNTFEGLIGYHFQDRRLLKQALTETQFSCASLSYERLEFLGDSLLQKVSGELLYDQFRDPEINGPGWLTVARSSLVDNRTLAFIAVLIGISQCLGNPTVKTCGDVIEAIIGAIWKDSSEYEATVAIKRLWSFYFSNGLTTDLEIGKDVVMDGGNTYWALTLEGKKKYQAAFDVYLDSLLGSLILDGDIDADGLKARLAKSLKRYREYDRRFLFQNFARIKENNFPGSTLVDYTSSDLFHHCILKGKAGKVLGEGRAGTKQEAEELAVAHAYYRFGTSIAEKDDVPRILNQQEREEAIRDLLRRWRAETNKVGQAVSYFVELETIVGKNLRTSPEVLNDGDKRARRVVTTVFYGTTMILRGTERRHRHEANRTAKLELLEFLSKGEEDGDSTVLEHLKALSSG